MSVSYRPQTISKTIKWLQAAANVRVLDLTPTNTPNLLGMPCSGFLTGRHATNYQLPVVKLAPI